MHLVVGTTQSAEPSINQSNGRLSVPLPQSFNAFITPLLRATRAWWGLSIRSNAYASGRFYTAPMLPFSGLWYTKYL